VSTTDARTRFQVRLTVTDVAGTPGFDAFGIVGSDPTADAVASAALPEHGLAVGADGSLWTCDGIAWAQLAGSGGTLGPVPNNAPFQVGTGTSYGTITHLTNPKPILALQGVGLSSLVLQGADGPAADLDGAGVDVIGGSATGTGDGGNVTIRGGTAGGTGADGRVRMTGDVDMRLGQWNAPAPYDESDDNILAMPLQRAYAVPGSGNVDLVLPYDCAVVSAVVYANAAGGGSTAAVSVVRDPGGGGPTLFTANVDSSGTSATILPGTGGKVSAGTTIQLQNATGGSVNVLITVLAFRT